MEKTETRVYTPQELNAHAFVEGAQDFSAMAGTRLYKMMKALVENDFSGYGDKAKVDQAKLYVMQDCMSNAFFGRGVTALAGWAFDFRPYMKRYVFQRYCGWEECYGFSKTLVRKMIGGAAEIHEIPNKLAKK